MLKNIKNCTSLLMFVMVLFIQMSAISAKAAGTCLSDKSDISEDTKKISQKLAVKYGKSPIENAGKVAYVKGNVDQIYDEQELYVDRSLPFLNQVNAVGVVTDAPMATSAGYATAVLISPCHILINAHAVVTEEARKGKAPIYVSLGQSTCDSKVAFIHQDIKGQVIASGNANNQSSDYAIVRIPKVSDIKPALISTEYILKSHSLMTVGFPYKSTFTQKTGFYYATVNFSKASGVGADGTFSVLNTSDSAGGSGSGVFILDEYNGLPQVVLGGIHRGQEGVGLQTARILEWLKTDNPLVYKELYSAISDKTCKQY